MRRAEGAAPGAPKAYVARASDWPHRGNSPSEMTGRPREKTYPTLPEALCATLVYHEASTVVIWFQAQVVVLYRTVKRIAELATLTKMAPQNKISLPVAYVKTCYDSAVDEQLNNIHIVALSFLCTLLAQSKRENISML